MNNVRPHPGPLPQERENDPLQFRQAVAALEIGRSQLSCDGRRRLPLLGGEGRGEGEPTSDLS